MSRSTFPYLNMPRMAKRIHMPPSLVRRRVPLQRQIPQTRSCWGLEENLKDTKTNLKSVSLSRILEVLLIKQNIMLKNTTRYTLDPRQHTY